jgi:Fe-S-cluster formation regulator IscX/YfhJ
MTDHHTPNADRERYVYTFADWLHTDIAPDLFGDDTPDVPPYRVSFGKAPGMRESRRFKVLGACMTRAASTDGRNEIFLDITTDEETVDPAALTFTVLETFIHEYCHAIDDCQSGHGGYFAKLARGFGLAGRLTSTTAGDELAEVLRWYIGEHGPLPAGAIRTNKRTKPKQSTRMVKVECDDHTCGFLFRASRAQIDKLPAGATCPACSSGRLEWDA